MASIADPEFSMAGASSWIPHLCNANGLKRSRCGRGRNRRPRLRRTLAPCAAGRWFREHPCFGSSPDPGFSFGLRASGSGFRAPLSTGGRRAGRRGRTGRGARPAGRSARRRASGGVGRRPVLPHAPVAQEDVRGHDGPAHDGHHGDPGCLALSRRAARTAPSSPGRTCGPPSPPCTGHPPDACVRRLCGARP